MRPIETEAVREGRKKRNTLVMSMVMLLVLVLGTIGFAFSFNLGESEQNSNPTDYDPYSNYWSFDANGAKLYFTYGPDEIKDIQVEMTKSVKDYAGKQLYVASENTAVLQEIGLSLGNYVPRVHRACLGMCEENLPEKSCDGEDNLIVWDSDAREGRVYQEENCVFIDGDLRAVDAFLYNMLGIN